MTDRGDDDGVTAEELRAIAGFMRLAGGGADNFVAALAQARLHVGGVLANEAVWRRIVEEMSLLETADKLEDCLTKRS